LADQLALAAGLDEAWNPRRSWNVNFERYLRREVLGKLVSGGAVRVQGSGFSPVRSGPAHPIPSDPDPEPRTLNPENSAHHSPHLVWGLDGIERLFSCASGTELSSLF